MPKFHAAQTFFQILVFSQPISFTTLHGTRRFITVFKTANQLCRLQDKLITVRPSDNIYGNSILIIFFNLRLVLRSVLLPSNFPTKTLHVFLFSSYVPHATPSCHPHLINTNKISSGAKIMKIIIKHILPSSCHFLRVRSKYLPHHPILQYLQPLFVRQPGRPSFITICNIRLNYSSLIKRSTE